jgi:hypothetical protein
MAAMKRYGPIWSTRAASSQITDIFSATLRLEIRSISQSVNHGRNLVGAGVRPWYIARYH